MLSIKERIANELHERIGFKEPWQLDAWVAAERLGIELHLVDGFNRAVTKSGRSFIFLDRSATDIKRWELFGHEVGHLYLHGGNQKKMNLREVRRQEWEADQFALLFCVPTFMLRQIPLEQDFRLATEQVVELFPVTPSFAQARLSLYKKQLGADHYVLSKT